MLKILHARLQQYMNRELPDVQAGFRKGRGTRDQIANIWWIIKKAREFQKKTSIFVLLTMPKPLIVWVTINWKILKEMGIPDHLTCLLTRWTFVGKVMSLLFNMLSMLVITFLPRSKHLLISWLQSPSAVILEPKKV